MVSVTRRTYADRAAAHPITVAAELLSLISRKSTNLCVSVDVTTKASLLRIVDAAGPYICCVKVRPRAAP
jgi:orotidine-5'-phosphate decarboxylase